MPIYRVREGNTFGRKDRPAHLKQAGDTVELNEREAAPLLGNVLDGPVGQEATLSDESVSPVDLSPYPNIDAVLDAVRAGELAAAAALVAERAGQGRVTLIRELEAMVDGQD